VHTNTHKNVDAGNIANDSIFWDFAAKVGIAACYIQQLCTKKSTGCFLQRAIAIASGNVKAGDRMVTGINGTRMVTMPRKGTMTEGQTPPRVGMVP
jgi:hypothetical protein